MGWIGLIAYLESTLLELSINATFVEILSENSANCASWNSPLVCIESAIEKPYKLIRHMTASNLLCMGVALLRGYKSAFTKSLLFCQGSQPPAQATGTLYM